MQTSKEKLLDRKISDRINNANEDGCGQTKPINRQLAKLFPDADEREEILNHINNGNSRYQLSLHGWSHGNFVAVNLKPTWRDYV